MTTTITDRLNGLSTSTAIKAPVKAVSTTTLTLSGEQTVNSVACVTGDRVLYALAGGSVSNGIWIVSTGAWSRAKDFDGNRDVRQGTQVLVATSAASASMYRVTTADDIVIGTTSIAFVLAGTSDASNITFLQSGATADARTVQEKLRDVVSVKDDSAVGDGATDDATEFGDSASRAQEVLAPVGTYLLESNNSTALTTSAATKFIGQGEKTIFDLKEMSTTGTSEFFTMGAAGFTLDNLKVKFSKALVGVSAGHIVKTRFNGISLRNLTIDGQTALGAGTTQDRLIRLIEHHDGTSTQDIDLGNCTITGVSRAFSRQNTNTGTPKSIKVWLSRFRDIWRTALTFNAPSGAIEDVLVFGSTFETHAGMINADVNLDNNNNAVGLIGVRGGRVIGNHVGGIWGSVVRVEENTNGAAIIGNTCYVDLTLASEGAMETSANNVGGATVVPKHLMHLGNVLRSSGSFGTGMFIQDGLSSGDDGAQYSGYIGNIAEGFDDGFKSAGDLTTVLVADNILSAATNAIQLTRASLTVRGNMLVNCPQPIRTDRGGLVGAVHYVNIASATAAMTSFGESASIGRLSLTEFTFETRTFSTANGTNYLDIGPMPTSMWGLVTIAITASNGEHRTSTFEVDYNGAFTNTSKKAYGSGDITIVGLADNAGKVAVQFADASGPTTGTRVQVHFHSGQFTI